MCPSLRSGRMAQSPFRPSNTFLTRKGNNMPYKTQSDANTAAAAVRRQRKAKIDYYAMGKRIQKIRRKRGVTQQELAEDLGVSFQYVSAIENGKSELSLDLLVAIANRLSVTTDELLGSSVAAAPTPIDPDVVELLKDCSEDEKELLLSVAQAAKRAVRK